MTIDSFDALFLTLAFLVPGFVMHSAIAISVRQPQLAPHMAFLRFLTMSCVNFAAWSWLLYLMHAHESFVGHPWRTGIAWLWVTLVAPGVLGGIIGHFQFKGWLQLALQSLGLRPIHAIESAWDFRFSRLDPTWVLVRLQDGSEVRGWFGSESFASSDPSEGSIFIERVYRLTQDGEDRWEPIPRSEGILLLGNSIKHVEFLSDTEQSGSTTT